MLKKYLILVLVITALFASTSCADKKTTVSGKPEVKTGVKPVADDEIAVILMEDPSFGVIKMELYSNIAPESVKRFKELAREGFYNRTTFHRVERQVIQGGDPNSKDNDPSNDGMGSSNKPNVPAEFSDVPFERGIVGMARTSDYNGANCQFFITLQRVQPWDTNYTVFGRVIEGLENAQKIAQVESQGTRPVTPVRIRNVTIQPR